MRRPLLICLLVLNLGACSLIALGWAGLLWFEHSWGCPGLIDPSQFANREHWSWFPPGQVCEYDVPGGGVHVDSPPAARVLIAVILVAWAASTVAFAVIGLGRQAVPEDRSIGTTA